MKAPRDAGSWTRTTLALALLVAPAAAQEIRRVNVDSSGAQANDSNEIYFNSPAISGDGVVVAFASHATNLVPGDTNNSDDVFVHDRSTGITELVSITPTGAQFDSDSIIPSVSHDGSVVAFMGFASGPYGWYQFDIYVRDRTTGITEKASVNSQGQSGDADSEFPAISSDGTIVAFDSYADNLVANDRNSYADVFVRDRTKGVTEIMSVSSTGGPADSSSYEPAISADGNLVVFESYAGNLVSGDTNYWFDIFLRNRSSKTTRRVSISTSGAQADQDCYAAAISADGSIVAFYSAATTLVPGDTNSVSDIFVRDLNANTTERVSLDSSGAEGNGKSVSPALSSDGRFVVFQSYASNLDPRDTNGRPDVFIHDRVTGTTTLLTINAALAPTDGDSRDPAISDDGGVVSFESDATDLVPGDTNDASDVFADDLTVPPVLASWSNYGSGYPGTNGIPTLTASANPVFGTTISIDAANSSGAWSVGFVPFGLSSTDVPTTAGGHLLVVPLELLYLPLLPSGGSFVTTIPQDLNLYGLTLYLQVIEIDPGAQHGLSFTPGLQMTLGQ